MLKRILALLLALSFMTIASCGDKQPDSNNTDDSVSNVSDSTEADTKVSVYDLLPDKTYDGRNFNVLVSEGWTVDTLDQVWVEEAKGDVVLDAVYERNRVIEEKFNVKITPRTVNYSDLAETVRREVQANETDTDLIVHAPTKLAPLAAERLFVDIHELPYADMTQPWYVKNVNNELEIAGKQYLFLTDFGFVFSGVSNVMLYNRDMAKDFALPDLQEKVLEGKWTLDLFADCVKNVSADLNGDTKMDNQDQYGIAIMWGEMNDTIPYSLGQKITEKDKDGKPQLALKNGRMDDIIRKVNSIFISDDCYISSTAKGDTWKTDQEMFRDGKTLFDILNITSITKRLRDMQDDYAVLTMPKYDENQDKYYTGISLESSVVMAVPVTVPDREFASVMIEAISAEGLERVLPAFIETSVKVKFSNDENSKEIYDLILDGRIIDFGAIYDSKGMYQLFRRMMIAESVDFASEYDAIEASTIAMYDEIYSKYVD